MWYKKKSNFRHYSLLAAVIMLSFTACKKSSNNSSQYEQIGTTNASAYTHMENVNTDVESMGDLSAVISFGNTNFYGNGGLQLEKDFDNHNYHHDGAHNGDDGDDFSRCAMITFNEDLSSRVLIIDFGTSNCTGSDGTNRRGQIIITFTGNFLDNGSMHTITFNNYFVNDNQLTGSKTITYMGLDSMGHPYYTIDISDTLWLGANNGYVSYNGQGTRTWIQGYNTFRRDDDVFQVTRTATIREANTTVLNINTTVPLQISPLCKWIESGIITISSQNNPTETIDFGSGNCDSEAQLTVNGHTYNITLNQ